MLMSDICAKAREQEIYIPWILQLHCPAGYDIIFLLQQEKFKSAGRSHSMKTDNSSTEMMEEFKYLGTTLTNQNSIQEEIKSRLKLWNACYYSVQNLLSSSLLSKKLKIKIYRTTILHVVLYGCETWSLTLREESRLRVFGETWGKETTGETQTQMGG